MSPPSTEIAFDLDDEPVVSANRVGRVEVVQHFGLPAISYAAACMCVARLSPVDRSEETRKWAVHSVRRFVLHPTADILEFDLSDEP